MEVQKYANEEPQTMHWHLSAVSCVNFSSLFGTLLIAEDCVSHSVLVFTESFASLKCSVTLRFQALRQSAHSIVLVHFCRERLRR